MKYNQKFNSCRQGNGSEYFKINALKNNLDIILYYSII